MRYLIEVKASRILYGGLQMWSKEVHLWIDDFRTICGMGTIFKRAEETDNLCTCKKCLAILEKRGRVEP